MSLKLISSNKFGSLSITVYLNSVYCCFTSWEITFFYGIRPVKKVVVLNDFFYLSLDRFNMAAATSNLSFDE
jgi:hypothetical protein